MIEIDLNDENERKLLKEGDLIETNLSGDKSFDGHVKLGFVTDAKSNSGLYTLNVFEQGPDGSLLTKPGNAMVGWTIELNGKNAPTTGQKDKPFVRLILPAELSVDESSIRAVLSLRSYVTGIEELANQQ